MMVRQGETEGAWIFPLSPFALIEYPCASLCSAGRMPACCPPRLRAGRSLSCYVTNTLHTHNPVKTIPEDALSQAVCPALHGLKLASYIDLLTVDRV